MTQKQLQLIKLIYDYKQTTGEAPTYTEMRKAIGVTSNQTVSDHLDGLERSGLIKRLEGRKRGIAITKRGEEALSQSVIIALPLLNPAVATQPVTGDAFSLSVVKNNSFGQPLVNLTTTFYGGRSNVTYNWDNQSSGDRTSG